MLAHFAFFLLVSGSRGVRNVIMQPPRVTMQPPRVIICSVVVSAVGPVVVVITGYRSHFGSRYKLGCCGNASLFL